ncbi:hypothetical protein Pan2_66 [Pseudanabaena phage Pan2]|nr:hypothetical protein Pan2_66 [Pseudanabaena phage Pan2]
MSAEGMTWAEAEAHTKTLSAVGRTAFFVREVEGGYATKFDGQEVFGVTAFALDSELSRLGASPLRNLYLIRAGDWQ